MNRKLRILINDWEGNKTIEFKILECEGYYMNEIDDYTIQSCASYNCIDKIIIFEKEIKEKGFTDDIKDKIKSLL